MNDSAFNYNASACIDDGSCIPIVQGCIDSDAFNYNAIANTDDGAATLTLVVPILMPLTII